MFQYDKTHLAAQSIVLWHNYFADKKDRLAVNI